MVLKMANFDEFTSLPKLYCLALTILSIIFLLQFVHHAHRTPKVEGNKSRKDGWINSVFSMFGLTTKGSHSNSGDLDIFTYIYSQFAIFGGIYCLHPMLWTTSPFTLLRPDNELEPMLFIELIARIIGASGCVSLALSGVWRQNIRDRYLPLYWRMLMIYCLPFLSGYTLLIAPNATESTLGFAFSTFILASFLRARSFFVSLIIGLIWAFVVYAIAATAIGNPLTLPKFDGAMLYTVLAILLYVAVRRNQEIEVYRVYGTSNAILAKVGQNHRNIREKISQAIKVFEQAVHVAADCVKQGDSLVHIYPGKRVMIIDKDKSQLMRERLEEVERELSDEITEVQKLVTSWGRKSNRLRNATMHNIISEVAADLWLKLEYDNTDDFKPVSSAKLISRAVGLLFSHINRNVLRSEAVKVKIAQGSITVQYINKAASGHSKERQVKIVDILSADALDLLLCQAMIASIGGAIAQSKNESGQVTLEIKLPGQHKEWAMSASI